MASDSFELQAKADEWMDVTPKEELLREELDRLKEAFAKCSSQLENSRLENNFLKDREASLERETEELRSSLQNESANLEETKTELATVQKRTCDRIQSLEETLSESEAELRIARENGKALGSKLVLQQQEHALALRQAHAETQRFERDLKASRAETKTHREAAVRFAEDLRAARETHAATKQVLLETNERLEAQQRLRAKAEETTGAIAVLAETLRSEKSTLEQSLVRVRREKTESQSKCADLESKLADMEATCDRRTKTVESELADRIEDLEAKGSSIEFLQAELKDAERTISESCLELASLKAHLAAMERGRHELLNRQSELEETVEELHDDLERAHQEIHSTRDRLETVLDSQISRTDLERRLREQRQAFDDRLAKIHAILGITFTTALRSEVREIRRSAVEQMMPVSARVPLLKNEHGHHGQRRSGIKTA